MIPLLLWFTFVGSSGGEQMTEFIWYWKNGNSKVFTRDTDVAERAMRNGNLVMGMKAKPKIQRF